MMKIGRYEVISELGRGAMGIVYRASDPTIGREVALKVLSLSASSEEGTNSPQQMFMREVRAAGRLAHPSIVAIYDAFEDKENQTSCIVMEMVAGVTFEKLLASDPPLTTEEAFDIVRQVAEGLDYAHRNQVIHRDLKPANILVTMDGRAKITDFGIAKVLAREGVARTVGVMGTPSFMSPEQVRGGDIDARSDIFSLGIIIYTILAGRKPFQGNTAAVMFKIVYEEPPTPSSLNPALSPAHDYVIKKCLAKDRNLRYSSARELLGDLDDLQHNRWPRSQAAAPAPAPAAPPAPAAAPRVDRTLAMPTPGVMKPAPPQPLPRSAPPTPQSPPPWQLAAAPPPKPVTPPSVAPVQATGPVAPPPSGATLAMPIPALTKGAPQPLSSRAFSAPPASPAVPVPPPKPVMPPPGTPAPYPNAAPFTGQTVPIPAPPAAPPSRPAGPMPSVSHPPTLAGRTVPMQPPSSPSAASAPPAPPISPLMDRTVPMPGPDLSAGFPAAGPQPVTLAPPFPPDARLAVQPAKPSGAVSPAPKSKLIPVVFGAVAVVLLAAVMWGYWKFHQARTAPAPPPQVAVQTPPATPPVVPPPPESVAPTPAEAPVEATPPPSAAPEVAKKPIIRKPRPAAKLQPSAPEPEPPPAQPQPAAVTPPPQPAPPTPSPEAIAKAEAARLANIPRIIQVLCNYGLKEATLVFSGGGKPLFEETLKGKKKKGGFAGINGSHQGTFTHTITVPAGVSEVSVRVLAKDGGGMDVTKAIKMPPPGGFVPTLSVEVDTDHMAINWQGSSAAK
jgi:serine/threonine-protein kinase